MKTLILTLAISAMCVTALAQNTNLNSATLTDLQGQTVQVKDLLQKDSPTLILFWNSKDKKSLDALQNLQDDYGNELTAKGINIITVYIGAEGSWTKVKPIVDGNELELKTYVDLNGDFQRNLNVGDKPCGLLYDSNQELIKRYNCEVLAYTDSFSQNIMSTIDQSVTAYNDLIIGH